MPAKGFFLGVFPKEAGRGLSNIDGAEGVVVDEEMA